MLEHQFYQALQDTIYGWRGPLGAAAAGGFLISAAAVEGLPPCRL